MPINETCPSKFQDNCPKKDNCPDIADDDIVLLGGFAHDHNLDTEAFRQAVYNECPEFDLNPEEVLEIIKTCPYVRDQVQKALTDITCACHH